MDFSCYLPHNSDFEPSDCAEYFKKQGLNVVITSDYSDDSLSIAIEDEQTHKSCIFESHKMDRVLYRNMLDNYPNLKTALERSNALAVIAPKNKAEKAMIFTLLSFLHNKHQATIFEDYQKKAVGNRRLKELRENSIKEYLDSKALTPKQIITKYHIDKIGISLFFIVAYLIFDAHVDYGTDMLFFVIGLSLIIFWVHF